MIEERRLLDISTTKVGSVYYYAYSLYAILTLGIGEFRYPELIPERLSLADSLRQVEGEEKILFHNFIMRMLRWMPEERSTTRELLVDPWLEANQ